MRTLTITLLALLLAGGEAAAQQAINERISTSPTGEVEIHNLSGSVRVSAWNRNEVQVTGTLGQGAERLEITPEGNRVRIRVILPREARNVRGTDLEIRVPARRDLNVRTVSANIDVTEVQGNVQARSVSGQVRVGGNSQSIDAESVSGNVEISANTPHVRAKTVSGRLRLSGVRGSADLSTVSGDTELEGGRFARLQFKSVSGDLRFRGDLERNGIYNLESHSGGLELRLPRATAADFDVRTFSGRITNEFGPDPERTSRHAPGYELRFTAGNGGAMVTARSFSGSVKLLRQ
ncbi:hypothetical protein BH24GEM3_BH24GEM3_01480 [soil metagenome]